MDSLGLGLSLALGLRFRVQQFRIWGLAFRHAIMTLIIAIPCAGVSLLAGVRLRSLDFLNGMMVSAHVFSRNPRRGCTVPVLKALYV